MTHRTPSLLLRSIAPAGSGSAGPAAAQAVDGRAAVEVAAARALLEMPDAGLPRVGVAISPVLNVAGAAPGYPSAAGDRPAARVSRSCGERSTSGSPGCRTCFAVPARRQASVG